MGSKSIMQPEIRVARKQAVRAQDNQGAELYPGSNTSHQLYSLYSSIVITAGATVLIYSAYRTFTGDMGFGWAVFALLTFLTAAFSLKMPKSEIRISVPDVFIFSSILLFGPAVAALTAAMEGLMGSLRASTKSRRLRFAAFNMTALSLSAYTAGKIYELSHPRPYEAVAHPVRLQQLTLSLVILAISYFILNTGLVALMISLQKRKNPFRVWMQGFSWMSVGYLAATLMAGILSLTTHVLDPISIALLMIVPVFTFAAYRHVIRIMSENIRLKVEATS